MRTYRHFKFKNGTEEFKTNFFHNLQLAIDKPESFWNMKYSRSKHGNRIKLARKDIRYIRRNLRRQNRKVKEY